MIQFKPKGKKPLIIDARDEDRGALRDALLPLLQDHKRVFIGQNLLFELHWMLSYLGMEVNDLRARFEDTMLRELVILGLGFGDAKKRGLAVNMHDIAERYGFPVHKEERSWFIDLDTRVEGAVRSPVGEHEECTPLLDEFGEEVFDDDGAPMKECYKVIDYDMVGGTRPWFEPFPQAQLEYARQDVSVVHLIAEKQQELIDQYGLQEVIDIEAGILPAVAGMQHYGLRIDRGKWLSIIDEIDQKAEELAAELHKHVDVAVLEHRRQEWQEKSQPYQQWTKERDEALDVLKYTWEHTGSHDGSYKGWGDYKKQGMKTWQELHPKPAAPGPLKDGVNLNSSSQMLVALRSRGHQITSTAEEVLTPLASGDPVVQLYLDYKDYNTARTKYGPAYLDEHAPNDTIYAQVQQIGAETGRFSVREPNIQQIPARGAGGHLREAIVPHPGYVFIDFDYSNIELRIAADMTGDPVMLDAFASGEDLHAKTAEFMFRLKDNPGYVEAEDKKEWADTHNAVVGGKELNGTTYRAAAKTINFMLLYGGGAARLASELRVDVATAKELMALYRETYKVCVTWLKKQGYSIEHPDKDGKVYAATLAGRRRWFQVPVLKLDKNTRADEAREALDEHKRHLAAIQRQLGNHPVQGTSAEITKWSISEWQEKYNLPEMRLVAAVHDELLIEVLDNPETIALARTRLEEVMREGLQHFLKRVAPGKIGGKTAKYWQH